MSVNIVAAQSPANCCIVYSHVERKQASCKGVIKTWLGLGSGLSSVHVLQVHVLELQSMFYKSMFYNMPKKHVVSKLETLIGKRHKWIFLHVLHSSFKYYKVMQRHFFRK